LEDWVFLKVNRVNAGIREEKGKVAKPIPWKRKTPSLSEKETPQRFSKRAAYQLHYPARSCKWRRSIAEFAPSEIERGFRSGQKKRGKATLYEAN